MINPLVPGGSPHSSPDDLKTLARNTARRELKKENLSTDSRVYKKIDEFLNLGSSKDILMKDLSPEERGKFFEIIAKLVKEGIVGYQEYEVNGRKEKHYLVNTIGDRRLYNKKLWRRESGA